MCPPCLYNIMLSFTVQIHVTDGIHIFIDLATTTVWAPNLAIRTDMFYN